jgi:hypothetical protein
LKGQDQAAGVAAEAAAAEDPNRNVGTFFKGQEEKHLLLPTFEVTSLKPEWSIKVSSSCSGTSKFFGVHSDF